MNLEVDKKQNMACTICGLRMTRAESAESQHVYFTEQNSALRNRKCGCRNTGCWQMEDLIPRSIAAARAPCISEDSTLNFHSSICTFGGTPFAHILLGALLCIQELGNTCRGSIVHWESRVQVVQPEVLVYSVLAARVFSVPSRRAATETLASSSRSSSGCTYFIYAAQYPVTFFSPAV